jgi:hypothetical protein
VPTNTRQGWKRMLGKNTIVYLFLFVSEEKKSFVTLTPGLSVIKLFLSMIYGFLYKARVFVGLGWKSLPGTNILASYENP